MILIIPEIWAHFANDLDAKKGINYGIFVQVFIICYQQMIL